MNSEFRYHTKGVVPAGNKKCNATTVGKQEQPNRPHRWQENKKLEMVVNIPGILSAVPGATSHAGSDGALSDGRGHLPTAGAAYRGRNLKRRHDMYGKKAMRKRKETRSVGREEEVDPVCRPFQGRGRSRDGICQL